MRTLNQRQLRWVIREMKKRDLSVWRIAKQQGITPRHARRLFARFKDCTQPRLSVSGRPAKIISRSEIKLVKELYAQQPFGATNLEKILSMNGQRIPHNRLHKILKLEGLACTQPQKSHRRKWIRYERKRANSLWHTDWSEYDGKWLGAMIDDASRLIVGYGLFDHATAENSVRILEQSIQNYGCPKQLISDHGTQFTSLQKQGGVEPKPNAFQQALKRYRIQHIKARVKHPQTNGKMERWFQTATFLTKHFGSLQKAVNYYNEQRPHMSLENGSLRTPLQAFMQKV